MKLLLKYRWKAFRLALLAPILCCILYVIASHLTNSGFVEKSGFISVASLICVSIIIYYALENDKRVNILVKNDLRKCISLKNKALHSLGEVELMYEHLERVFFSDLENRPTRLRLEKIFSGYGGVISRHRKIIEKLTWSPFYHKEHRDECGIFRASERMLQLASANKHDISPIFLDQNAQLIEQHRNCSFYVTQFRKSLDLLEGHIAELKNFSLKMEEKLELEEQQ